jgi:hypothetical protein
MQRHTLVGFMLGAALLPSLLAAQGPATDFKPDTIFTGSGLGAWIVVGDGAWTAEKGEVVGRARTSRARGYSPPNGGSGKLPHP